MTNSTEQEQRAKILVEQTDRLLTILGVDVSNVPIRDPAHIAWSGRPAVFRLAANAYAKLAEADRKTKDRVLWDRAERKETWSITMEAAITLFVAVELVFSILNFLSHKGSFVQQA